MAGVPGRRGREAAPYGVGNGRPHGAAPTSLPQPPRLDRTAPLVRHDAKFGTARTGTSFTAQSTRAARARQRRKHLPPTERARWTPRNVHVPSVQPTAAGPGVQGRRRRGRLRCRSMRSHDKIRGPWRFSRRFCRQKRRPPAEPGNPIRWAEQGVGAAPCGRPPRGGAPPVGRGLAPAARRPAAFAYAASRPRRRGFPHGASFSPARAICAWVSSKPGSSTTIRPGQQSSQSPVGTFSTARHRRQARSAPQGAGSAVT